MEIYTMGNFSYKFCFLKKRKDLIKYNLRKINAIKYNKFTEECLYNIREECIAMKFNKPANKDTSFIFFAFGLMLTTSIYILGQYFLIENLLCKDNSDKIYTVLSSINTTVSILAALLIISWLVLFYKETCYCIDRINIQLLTIQINKINKQLKQIKNSKEQYKRKKEDRTRRNRSPA